MRKFYSFLLATVALLCSTAANAQSFTIDNLDYAILSSTDKTVELTGGSPSGELVIPSTVTYESVDYTVTEVAAGAFQYNKTMTSVTIPATIEYIRSAAFSDCSNVTAFNVAADNATYVSENGVIYTKDMSTIILCPNTTTGVYKIRANVSTIGDCAFDGCTKIEKIIIPQSVNTIGQYAFANCELLTELTIPASVTSLHDTAFGAVGVDDCDNLKEITLLATTPPTWYGAMQILPEDVKINVPAGAAATYAATYGWTEFTNIVEANGKCGDNAYWTLDEETGALTIFGTGEMYNYAGNDTNRAPWYSNKENITSVTIEEGVTSIGNFAFDDCYNLTSIEIPSSVTSIGESAFEACYGLTSIEIPSSVTSIGDNAFAHCTGLTSITSHIAAENLFAPGNNAFLNVDKNACTLYVPAGAKSTYAATEQWKDFTNIVEPNGKCGDNAYWTLNEETGALTIFGTGAMYNYNHGETPWHSNKENITSVTIEEGVTSIGNCAFWNCSGLTSIEIPSNVTSIGKYTFDGCNDLTSIVVDEGNTIYDSRGNCNAIIETASNTLILGCKNTIIPASVTSIGGNAFISRNGLTSIEIPSSVTSIGDGAFADCPDLTSIEIPSSVTSIGMDAFYWCTGLTSIEIPSSVTSIGSNAFIYCTGLTSIVSHIAAEDLFIPGSYAFYGVDKDACTIYVPAGAKSTYAATEQWKDFTNIVEPNGKCGDNAYWALNEETGALTIFGTGAMYNYNSDETPWHSNKENITSVTIEEGVTSIGESAFYDCTILTSIEIPSSVTSIGEWAFWSCSGLTSIEIPSSVTSIGNYAFDGCNGLTSIVVDEGNTIYDSRGNCNAIIEAASNTLIRGCKNTVIPEGVTSIGYNAFISCTGLTSIEIPSSVTSIGDGAFAYCTGLTSIEIPSSVTSIGKDAFCDCTSLTSIVSHIAAEDLFAPGDNAFAVIDKDACTLYVPAGAKSTYAATYGWNKFTNIVETYDLTVTAAGYATLYLGTAVEIPTGVEAYTAARIEGDLLKMQAVEDVIPANTAVIIKAEEGKYTFIPSNETPDAIEGNLLRGTLIDTYIKPASAQTAYVLSKVDGIVGMYRAKLKADGTFKNNANRVYMLLGDINVGEGDLDTSNPGGQLSNGYRFDFSGTTAIDSVEAENAAPAVYYDLSGRRVENPTKGIYIVNGRKVFIK